MARKGKFGRSASGSQNLSSLVYSLLKEERNNQEDTMLTAYGNNMRSGSAAGLFTSNGTTLPATAANLVAWYKAQAAAADAVGDSAGAERFRTKAEEFRIQSLRDIETVLDNAYQNGNSIDLSLIGGSGSAKIDGAEYEKWMNTILNDSAMTTSDKERLKSKLFTVSYNYSAENMVNGFNEKKYTAGDLVSFYDKELERAKQNGLTETSKTYRDIVAARASAVARQKSDAQAARLDTVEAGLRDETDAMADAIQRLIKPVIQNYFSSSDIAESLLAEIKKGNGDDWLVRFSNAVSAANINVTDLFDAGATANGLTTDEMRQIAGVFSALGAEVKRLTDAGYATEVGKWVPFADSMNTQYTDGAFAASTRPFVTSFNGSYAEVGGSLGVQFSGEPAQTRSALDSLVGSIAGAGNNANVTDSATISQISNFGQGMLGGLVSKHPEITSVAELVDYLAANGATKGMNKTDIANGISEWLFSYKNNPNASISGSVPAELYNLGINTTMLDNQIGGSGGLTTGDVLRLNIESSYIPQAIKETVDANGNATRAIVYKLDPKTNEFAFKVVPSGSVAGKDYVVSVGKGGELYYTQAIPYISTDGSGTYPIKFVPVPGGGNYAGGNDANDLVIIDYTGGYGAPIALTSAQLEDFASWYSTQNGSGGDMTGFRLQPDPANPGKMQFTAGADLIKALSSSSFFGGLNIYQWLTAAKIDIRDISVTNIGGNLIIGDDFISQYRREIFDAGLQGTDARSAVSQWLKDTKGIADPGGKIMNMILSGLMLTADNNNGSLTWKIIIDNNTYTNSQDNTQDNLPPAPSGRDTSRDVASTDPGFGIIPPKAPIAPTQAGIGAGGVAGVRGTEGTRIPTSDLIDHTFRNLKTNLAPVSLAPTAPGGVAPMIAPGVNPDSPAVTAPTIAPSAGRTAPNVPGPSMRPMSGPRQPVVERTAMRNL